MDLAAVLPDAVTWRRHLHEHPELSFHEHETAAFIRRILAGFDGLELETPTETSVVARLRGPRPGATLAMRADIDALPIQEATGVEFASRHDGVMHACGHDGHTAMMLAAARVLSRQRAELAGEIRFIFQHAEELPPGGATELVAAGVLDGVDAIIGAHLASMLEVGRIAAHPGPFTAAADTFSVTIRGRGGHAAFPHETIDPIVVAAQAISNLQHVVAREAPPLERVVVSVTRIVGGSADNVIPESVQFGGTVRTFSSELRDRTRAAIARVLEGVSAAHRATCEFEYVTGYDPVINDPALAALVSEVAGERAIDFDPVMAGEDFSAYLRACPGVFFFVGAGGAGAFPHHHPRFAIDERALETGIDVLVRSARRYLSESPAG
jgi:amidohydrolase